MKAHPVRTKNYRTNVGTWRATSECWGDVLWTVFPLTWHATSLHVPVKNSNLIEKVRVTVTLTFSIPKSPHPTPNPKES